MALAPEAENLLCARKKPQIVV